VSHCCVYVCGCDDVTSRDSQVRQLRHRLLQFRYDDGESTSTQDRKAFVTTVILLATLTFFFLPHTVYFFISLNTSISPEPSSGLTSIMLVLYMTLLPYLKMMTDPLVYGVRMCRRSSASAAITSRLVYADAASTPAVLRGGPRQSSTSPAVTHHSPGCLCCSMTSRRHTPVNHAAADTYTAVMSSGTHSWTRSASKRRRSPASYSAIRLQTMMTRRQAADDNVEQTV